MIFSLRQKKMHTKTKTTLIRGGTVVSGQTVSQQDLLIQGENISALGKLSGLNADTEIDASGLLVLPGAVDTHVHFNDEFMNTISVHDYYTGTLAAAFGGVTSIVDFSNQVPGEPLINTLKSKKDEAKGKAMVDWGVHPVITQPSPVVLSEIPLLADK
jgi:dihydropyrimidinase